MLEREARGLSVAADARMQFVQRGTEPGEIVGTECRRDVDVEGDEVGSVQRGGDPPDHDVVDAVARENAQQQVGPELSHATRRARAGPHG